jgi:hypothetical protein
MDTFLLLLNSNLDLYNNKRAGRIELIDGTTRCRYNFTAAIREKNINLLKIFLPLDVQSTGADGKEDDDDVKEDDHVLDWKGSAERFRLISKMFKIQTILDADDSHQVRDSDVEYEMVSNHFLLRNDIILHYIFFDGSLYFLNNLYSRGSHMICNWVPTFFVPFSTIVEKNLPRFMIPKERDYYLDVIDTNPDQNKNESFATMCDTMQASFQKFVESFSCNFPAIFPDCVKRDIRKALPQRIQSSSNDNTMLTPLKRQKIRGRNTSTHVMCVENHQNLALTEISLNTVSVSQKLPGRREIAVDSSANGGAACDAFSTPKIVLITFGWNEQMILEMFFKYYAPQVDCIVYYDNESTDETRHVIDDARSLFNTKIVLETFCTQDEIRDDLLLELKNEAWKKYADEYDWAIIVDVDEFIVPPLRKTLRDMLRENSQCDAIQAVGYQMFGTRFEYHNICKGARCDQYDKVCCWNLKTLVETNYAPGCHKCQPIFSTSSFERVAPASALKPRSAFSRLQVPLNHSLAVRRGPSQEINEHPGSSSGIVLQRGCQLRHMKYVGPYQFLCERVRLYQGRLSAVNKAQRWGAQYNLGSFKKNYMYFSKKSVDITVW